jgi:flagellar biosynthesis protein FlhG
VIAVTSGKGGVGKTSFTINIGLAIAQRGKRVLILDADLGMANVNVAIGVPARYNLFDVILGRKTLREIVVEGPGGLLLVPGGSGIAELANIGEAQRQRLMEQFSGLGDMADIILVDTAAGLSKNVLAFAAAADSVIVVTIPEPPAIADAYAIMKSVFRERPDAEVNLVVNRIQRASEGRAVFDKLSLVVQRFLGKKIQSLGAISDDPHVSEAIRSQKPLLLKFPDAAASKAMKSMVPSLFVELKADEGGIVGFLKRLGNLLGG